MYDASDFPVRVPDTYGDLAVIDVIGAEVTLDADPKSLPLIFDGPERDAFALAWVAASHVADRAVSSDG